MDVDLAIVCVDAAVVVALVADAAEVVWVEAGADCVLVPPPSSNSSQTSMKNSANAKIVLAIAVIKWSPPNNDCAKAPIALTVAWPRYGTKGSPSVTMPISMASIIISLASSIYSRA